MPTLGNIDQTQLYVLVCLTIYTQVDEVTKGIKVTSLNAKKSGIKTNSVHQARYKIPSLCLYFKFTSSGGHPTSVPNWINLSQQNLTKAGGQLAGSFHLRLAEVDENNLYIIS